MNDVIRKIIVGIYNREIKLNVCNLHTHLVTKFTNKKINEGASPTSLQFSTIIFNSVKGNPEIPVIAKIFLIPPNTKYYFDAIYGLLYEGDVYNRIVNHIIADNLSPNFIGSFGYGECSIQSVLKYFRSTKFIDVLQETYEFPNSVIKKSKIGITLNPAVPNARVFNKIYLEVPVKEQINMLFQIIYSLAVMSKFRLIHNDLHSQNILVDGNKKLEHYIFVVDRRIYSVETKYVPLLFDWDRAYSDYLGINKYLDIDTCLDWNTCNNFKNNFDLGVLLCTLESDIPPELEQLKKMYHSKEIYDSYSKNTRKVISVSNDEMKRIKQLNPLSMTDNIFKLSRGQLEEIFKDRRKRRGHTFANPFIDEQFPRMLNVVIEIVGNNSIEIFAQFYCRYTANLEGTLSPEDIIRHTKLFDMLRVDKIPDNIKKENIFHLPTKEYITRRINMDIRTPSTRHLIHGKPFFKKPVDSGYVKGEDNPKLNKMLDRLRREKLGI